MNIDVDELSYAEVHDPRRDNESIAEGEVRGYSTNSKGEVTIYLETGYSIKLKASWNVALKAHGG